MQVADLTNDEVKSHLQVINLLPFSFPSFFFFSIFLFGLLLNFFLFDNYYNLKKKKNKFAEISAPCPEDG